MHMFVQKRGEVTMLLPAPSGKRSRSSGSLPEPGGDFGDYAPFLNAATIGKVGTRAKIKITAEPDARETEFSDVQLPVMFKGKEYSFGLKSDKPNYSRLFDRFGKNPKKWVGKTFEVEIKRHMKKDYVAVV